MIHVALTPVFEPVFSPSALWFSGAGLALVFLGLLNIVSIQAKKRSIFSICLIANFLGIIYGVFIVVAAPEPQAFTAIVLFIAVITGSVYGRKKSQSVETTNDY